MIDDIKEREGVAKIGESQDSFHKMLAALPVAIYTTDAEGRLTYFNPAAVEFAGREPKLGTDRWCVTWKLFYPDGTPMPHDGCPMAMALKEERSIFGQEAIAERPDGERIWFIPYPSPLFDDEDNIIGGINMFVDITEQKKAEKQSRQSEQEFTDLFNNATVGLHFVGPDGIILRANRAELDLLGYSRDEYVGHHIADFYVEQDDIDDILEKLSAGEELDSYETRMRCKDGSVKDVIVSSNVLWEDDEFIHTRCFTRDVTERKQAEQALSENEQRLRLALEIGGIGSWEWDVDSNTVKWSENLEKLHGMNPGEFDGKFETFINAVHPADRDEVLAKLQQAMDEGESYNIEHRWVQQDGNVIWLEGQAVRDEEGNVVRMTGTCINITRRKRHELLQTEQKRLLELIASGVPLDECLSALCSTIPKLNPGVRASVLRADDQCKVFHRPIAPDLLPSFSEGLEGAPISELFVGTCGTAVYTGKPVRCKDIANDEKWSKEWRYLCVANNVRACHSAPIPGKDGKALGSFMLCFDKPREPDEWEQRLAEFGVHIASIAIDHDQSRRALRASEEKYRTLFESIDEGFCIIEVLFDENKKPVDYRYLEVNPAFEKQTGLEDVEGKRVRELVPDHEEHWFEFYGQVALTGESNRFESTALGRFYDVYAFPFGQEGGHKVAVIFSDISERKKSLEKQKRLLREVEAEREKLADVFQYAPSIMAILHGPDHVFERVNERYKQLVGKRELIGKTARETFPETEEQGFLKLLDQVYQTGEAYVGTDVPVILEPPEGGPPVKYFLNFVYQPIRDPDGEVTGIFAQGVDLTERKRVEEDLKEINETLEEKVDERTSALLSYQRQLRSLANQLSRAEEEERRRLAEELHDNLGQMLAVAKMKVNLMQKTQSLADLDETADLVDDALVYTRELMSDLKPPPSLGGDDINTVLHWVAGKMKKYDLNVVFEGEEPKPLDEDIKSTLTQAVRELLFNVVKHAGTQKAHVNLTYPDNCIKIIVEDEGSGFNPGNIEVDSSKGGFGLFNIKERIDLLGGQTDIDSVPGEGTTVTLTVPLNAEGVDSLSVDGSENRQIQQNLSKKQKQTRIKVLLVDDHEMMREGLKRIIEQEDDLTVVAEAPDGQSAVELARETRPDVVIMDINLPGMNGIDATEKIKADLPEMRIIGLSLHNDEEVKREMRNAGASAYLNKSNAFETLCATIRSEGMTGTAESE